MSTSFNINGTIKTLEMRDTNNIDWSSDFIGNTSHGMQTDEDGNYLATEEEYVWWRETIAAHQRMATMIAQYQDKYGADEVTAWLETSCAYDVDLEHQPSSVTHALQQLD